MSTVDLEESDPTLAPEAAEVVARRLAALGEPTRLRLVIELRAQKNATVHELSEAVGGSLPNTSKHLQVLHHAGLVVRSKEGTFVRYRLASDVVGALATYAVRILGRLRRGAQPLRLP